MVVSLADFDFELPPDRIAQSPTRPRDAARLLCVRPRFSGSVGQRVADNRRPATQLPCRPPARPGDLLRRGAVIDGRVELGHDESGDAAADGQVEPGHNGNGDLDDRVVRDLPQLLRPGDVLVANDTRVIPAQLTGWRGEARIGITLDQPQPDGTWHALARNARRLHVSDLLRFDGDLTAEVTSRDPDGGVTLRFNHADEMLVTALRQAGALALPPYIHRPNGPEPSDAADYQTIFAVNDGAVAAPTAGLHFTPDLLTALDTRGVRRVTVTLHVGAGTFLPVRTDEVTQHQMHVERGTISATAARTINAARMSGGRVVAVGTTSLRLLESATTDDGTIGPFDGETSLFILPGYRFRAVDLLMTNFHLPRSTLFMLVCAFAGIETMRAAYAHAIASGYRFYSYGDSSLLWRHDH
jgi:S-adenosylmethionine:tRNA ribosyltransferase-isomerase